VAGGSSSTNVIVSFDPPTGMVLIPEGTFTMGNYLIIDGSTTNDPDITDANPTNITVSAFYMEVNLVTSNQWAGVYSYATNHGYTFVHPGQSRAANYPVGTVDWFDCVKWCNARSQQAGLAPVYYTDAGFAQIYTNGETAAVYADWGANGYRLPTEAEREKAARGGLGGQRFPWGNTISESQANYIADPNPPNSAGYTYDLGPYTGANTNFYPNPTGIYSSPGGYFAPNGYGLYDMAGNVGEWCWDWYGTPYGQPSDTNPTGPATGSKRVLRGGAFNSKADHARCAYRYPWIGTVYAYIGFRCVRGH
jgi:formylglycine-generating enzyme required for sulfatase activity